MVDYAKQGKQNKAKGSREERRLVNIFKKIGYEFCKTSRLASKLLDNSKIDLAFIPYNFQCKKVLASINYKDLILSIKKSLKENIPEEDLIHDYPIVIAHKRGRAPEDHLIIMESSSFIDMMGKIKEYEIIQNELMKQKKKNAETAKVL